MCFFSSCEVDVDNGSNNIKFNKRVLTILGLSLALRARNGRGGNTKKVSVKTNFEPRIMKHFVLHAKKIKWLSKYFSQYYIGKLTFSTGKR